jgi:hypothetical protein
MGDGRKEVFESKKIKRFGLTTGYHGMKMYFHWLKAYFTDTDQSDCNIICRDEYGRASMPVTCIGYCRECAFKRPGSKFSLEKKTKLQGYILLDSTSKSPW